MLPATLLMLEAVLAVSLAAGALLARRKQYGWHQALQTTVVAANVVIVGLVMIPSLHRQLGAGSAPAIVWLHACAGSAALLVAVYVVISAGFGWLGKRKVTDFKTWMRTALGLWWAAFLLGTAVYYTLNAAAPSSPAANIPPAVFQVTIQNFSFEPKELTVPSRAEVQWTDLRGRHSVQADDGSFNSGPLTANGTFKHRFDKPGRYAYFCEFHGSSGGHDMAGAIVVQR